MVNPIEKFTLPLIYSGGAKKMKV